MKKSLFTLLAMLLFGVTYAQYSSQSIYYEQFWNHGLHADNATFAGFVYIDGQINDNPALELGAYDIQDPNNIHVVSGVRGVLQSGQAVFDHLKYFPLVNGEAGDKIIWKLYDLDNEVELDMVCLEEYTFVVNDQQFHYEWHFITPKDMLFEGLEDDQWSNEANWTADGELAGRLPQAFEDVTIAAPCTLDMNAEVASVAIESALTIGSGDEGDYTLTSEITIKDGGQFFAPAGSQYSGTIEKEIMGYENSSYGNYYFLSIPITGFDMTTGFEAAGMLNGDYDLYYFTQHPDQAGPVDPEDEDTWWCGEWINYKWYLNEMSEMLTFTDIYKVNDAYLYANKNTTTLSFNGSFYNDNGQFTANWNQGTGDRPGFQMIGNPWPSNASVTWSTASNTLIGGCYMLSGSNIALAIEDPIVAPATALMFQCTGSGGAASRRRVTFTPTTTEANVTRSEGTPRINVEVLVDGELKDRAYMRMYESENLVKFNLSNDGAKLFIPQNGKKYAAVYVGEAKSMPLCFTSTEGGIHTITVKAENMSCSYLHLIDNVTGADIDLLRTPKYSFDANDSNYATRFKLVFDEQATDEIADNFAFISNGELMINNSGNATLQVMDITGRILSTDNIQNCYSKSLNLSAGVYVVRLSNGNDVKAQKIVVE